MSVVVLAAICVITGAVLWVGPAPRRVRSSPLLEQIGTWLHGNQQRFVSLWRRHVRAEQQRQQIARFAIALADELSAGLPASTALSRAAAECAHVPHTSAAVAGGGDVAEALLADAYHTGSVTLRGLSAAWQVASGSGAGLARACRSLGTAALQRERIRRDLAGHLAGPRSTARILAVLPVVGLFLGSGFGGSPLTWLVGTPVGIVVLTAGLVLEILGLLWVRRLVRRVEQHL